MTAYSMCIIGLMGNIVDGIQRPLRVSQVCIRYTFTTLTDINSLSKNYQSLYISLVASTLMLSIDLFSGNSSPVPSR